MARFSTSVFLRHMALLVAIVVICGSLNLTHADENGNPLGLVVVMNPDVDIRSINDEELRRLFMGKSRRLPNGARAALARYAPESSLFNERILRLSDSRVAALWSRLLFSGRTPPPRTFDDAQALVEYVASTPNAIAYMPASVARQGVRVVSNVPR